MSITQTQILALLKGHDAQHPLCFDALVQKSGLEEDTLKMVLQQLFDSQPRPINCAQITKGGKTYMVYWPTGEIARLSFHTYTPMQPRTASAPTKPTDQGDHMNTNAKSPRASRHSALRELLIQLITATPNQTCEELYWQVWKKHPDMARKPFSKQLWDMVNVSKQLQKEGRAQAARYRLTGQPAPVAAPVALAKTEATQGQSAAAQPKVKKTAAPAPQSTAHAPAHFSISIDDSDYMLISTEHIDLELSPAQTARLYAFMHRVQLGAV